MAPELRHPAGGLPPVLSSPEQFSTAAHALAAGSGPIAVDTERASAYRYNDRAFLVQLKRADTATFLLAPEGHRRALSRILAPVLNDATWIIHAAPSDLPSLAWLGLHPSELIDTELAGRLAGLDKVNLSAMHEELLGVHLAKGHGAQDWSRAPLPKSWVNYAALDVERLGELAYKIEERLRQQGKWDWALEEFVFLVDSHSTISEAPTAHWTDLKSLHTLRRPVQLAIARQLWQLRDTWAQYYDYSPGSVLSNKELLEIARTRPTSIKQLRSITRFHERGPSAQRWLAAVRQAIDVDPKRWPDPASDELASIYRRTVPSSQTWKRDYPDSWEQWQQFRDALRNITDELDLPMENLLLPASAKRLMWAISASGEIRDTEQLDHVLADERVRAWQKQFVRPVLADFLSG